MVFGPWSYLLFQTVVSLTMWWCVMSDFMDNAVSWLFSFYRSIRGELMYIGCGNILMMLNGCVLSAGMGVGSMNGWSTFVVIVFSFVGMFGLICCGLVFSDVWLWALCVSVGGEVDFGGSGIAHLFSHGWVSSGLGALNFLSTAKHQRHAGLSLLGCSIFVWGVIITSFLLIGSLPFLGVAVTGLLLDRNVATSVYDGISSGDPVLYQHLFWFFGHPEVYVIILPIFGLASLILSSVVHKEIFGRVGMIFCMSAIGVVGFFVWSHHMFTVGLDVDSRAYFSSATAVISIPTAVKVFSYMASWSGGRGCKGSSVSLSFFAFLFCFTCGGFSGLMLSSGSLDLILHDTYFVVGHFHTVLSLGAVFGLLLGHCYFVPVLFGVGLSESNSLGHVNSLLLGALFVFYPMHLLGLSGMARRVPEYGDVWFSG